MGARRDREERDPPYPHFNPRARMGARPVHAHIRTDDASFQSTRPHGGAT